MHKIIATLVLSATAASAFAITAEDISANSWMPLVKEQSSKCELPATITFHKDGKISGEPGCNYLTGTYQLDADGKIDLSGMGMTRKLCAKEYMEQEENFLNLLSRTHYLQKADKQLILLDADKKEVGRLVPEKAKACD
ncbi:META domain-containing protein [Parasutterella muris]|uniref:META domain-containing protein n=1 Tax=Parasutterella muris TaxID=2565572 RepID=UPI00203B5840|nr:META domain-containing protein [Parasutterella muris]